MKEIFCMGKIMGGDKMTFYKVKRGRPKKANKKVGIMVFMPTDIRQAVQRISLKRQCSVSYVILEAVNEYILKFDIGGQK